MVHQTAAEISWCILLNHTIADKVGTKSPGLEGEGDEHFMSVTDYTVTLTRHIVSVRALVMRDRRNQGLTDLEISIVDRSTPTTQ